MSQVSARPADRYIRRERLPYMFCAGCGVAVLLNCFARALGEANFDIDKLAVISGIGCAGRIAGYLRCDGYHTTHGRAIPFATGVKIANPGLKTVVISGDGDLFAIGGNHFIHAARRNIDMLVICSNNYNYGMTGGQVGPTTPPGKRTTTTPHGSIEEPFNLVQLAAAVGAIYVARWTTLHVPQLIESIRKGFQKHGFAFIEVISPCPTYFGRYNISSTNLDILKNLKEASVVKHHADPAEAQIEWGSKGETKIVVGEFTDRERPEFADQLKALTKQFSEEEKEKNETQHG